MNCEHCLYGQSCGQRKFYQGAVGVKCKSFKAREKAGSALTCFLVGNAIGFWLLALLWAILFHSGHSPIPEPQPTQFIRYISVTNEVQPSTSLMEMLKNGY